MSEINKTQLNKLKSKIDKNTTYLNKSKFRKESADKKNSMALSMFVLMEYFGLNQISAHNNLTDGSGDNKIDALYYSDDSDELSELIIIQSKYKQEYGSTGTFTEDEIKLCIKNCEIILSGGFFQTTNKKLKEKLVEYRKLLKDNELPPIMIKLFFITNGIIHNEHKKLKEVIECLDKNIDIVFIDTTSFSSEDKFVQENGVISVNLKDSEKDKTDSIFSINSELYSGIITSCSIKELMIFYKNSGESFLLNNNVRFLLKRSNINKEIKKSFIDDPKKFCYLNNGISLVCSDYTPKPTGHEVTKIELVKPNIINGGQTLALLYQLYSSSSKKYEEQFKNANILIRIYKVPEEYILEIAKATNSQNPINIVDLHSNDLAQRKAKKYLSKFGVGLITKIGEDVSYYDDTITNENILQIYASLFCDDPAKAKTSKALIFKKYYEEVFNENIDNSTYKKLHRCYQIAKFIQEQTSEDAVLIKNAFYSIIYTMKKIESGIINQDIPNDQIQEDFKNAFRPSIIYINEIIDLKQEELETKFSMNNLFKGNEIKDLIDLKLDKI